MSAGQGAIAKLRNPHAKRSLIGTTHILKGLVGLEARETGPKCRLSVFWTDIHGVSTLK